MRTRHRFTLFVLLPAALVLVWAVRVNAQFQTPSRAFHNTTSFRLDGKHASVACESCHLKGQYKGTPTTCYECHWVRRKDDRYQTRLGTQCEQCHRTTAWNAVQWDHAGQTGVVLNASHRQLTCETCHRDGNFKSGTGLCFSCHQKEYLATKSPNHVAAAFPTTCDSCHRPSSSMWTGAGFNHAGVFPLVGIHATQACTSCHVGSVYRGTSRVCAGCHLPQYTATKTPSHVAAGFATTCETCHLATDTSWMQGRFNHSSVFPLVGIHATQACTSCHVGSVYRGTSRTCSGCHMPQYTATKTPSHIAAGFPTTCETCHQATDALWTLGRFAHTQFPITGHHNVPCVQCHTVTNNFLLFNCTVCHARSSTDSSHRGRSGYVYDSNACYACHRNGRAG